MASSVETKNDFVKDVIQCLKETKESKGMTIKEIEKYILSKNDKGDCASLKMNIKLSVWIALKKGQIVQNAGNQEILLPFERHRVSLHFNEHFLCSNLEIK